MSAVHLTDHALERFQQRVRPGLTFEQAEDELARLLEGSASGANARTGTTATIS
jgi:hypothetical protein